MWGPSSWLLLINLAWAPFGFRSAASVQGLFMGCLNYVWGTRERLNATPRKLQPLEATECYLESLSLTITECRAPEFHFCRVLKTTRLWMDDSLVPQRISLQTHRDCRPKHTHTRCGRQFGLRAPPSSCQWMTIFIFFFFLSDSLF